MTNILITRFDAKDVLSGHEQNTLQRMTAHRVRFSAKQDIIQPGDRPSHSTLLISGYMARFKILTSGRRQILAFHLPGDFVDLDSFILRQLDYGVTALTDAEAAIVQHANLHELTETHPHIARLLWLSTLIDAAVHRQWLVTASMAANQQLAHLICEIYARLAEVGMARDFRFDLPVTQEIIGQAMGMSSIHVNRSARDLRERCLVEWNRPTILIPDWDRLAEFGGFNPQYLQVVKEPR